MIRLSEIAPLTCRQDTKIADVLRRLSESSYLFLLVTDETGRLVGTITDGDARRAFLRGVRLDDSAAACMQREPIVGRVDEEDENLRRFGQIRARNAFLPIVDADGVISEVLYSSADVGQLSALVMAGGPGTRLGELTRSKPKPLLSVGDRPILDHILERLEQAGIHTIYVSVHYLAEQIEAFIAARDNAGTVQVLHETERMGTAGALSQMPEAARGEVLVVNADIMTKANFSAIESFHHRQGHDATIAVANYEVQVPYGVVRHTEDGIFQGIDEKPRQMFLAAAGIYLLSPQFTALVPPDRAMDMPELLNLGRSIGLRVGVFPIHEYWVDIGRPHDLENAMRDHIESERT
ncbi:MAG: alcohol dehydrogenase [Alphaproteobacteria bacterium]|nr:alcohol dehydrogenase [Alphaproteobacteria bacterium]|tara:strand:- start:1692 stop:2744 length:1053 start_codon:yes stop_codon:yes gene_type:complete